MTYINLDEIIKQSVFVGIMIGIFILEYLILIIISLSNIKKINRHEKYLIETKQSQKYNEWLNTEKFIEKTNLKKLFE